MPNPVKPDSSNDRLRERRDVPRTHAGTRLRTVLAAASLVLAVCEAASAQSKVQGSRVGTQVGGSRGGSSVLLPDSVRIGRGQSLGDGNALGGQTFSWFRGAGSGRSAGSGNILDANTQLGSGGANAGPIPVDYNARNLLVTGSVPGGRGFRGSVGYTADTDFRDRLGSDDTFAFRADSAFSNPVFSSSAVARDRFLVAQGLGVFEFRREATPMSSANLRAASDRVDNRLRLDRANAQMSFTRANWDIGSDRTIIDTVTQRGDSVRYIISPLRGLQIENLKDPLTRTGLNVYERARARRDMAMGLTTMDDYGMASADGALDAPDPRKIDLRVNAQSEGERLRLDGRRVLPQSYLDLVDAINGEEKPAQPEGAAPGDATPGMEGMTPLDRVRESLESLRPDAKPADETTRPATGDGKQDSTEPLVPADGVPRGGEAEREAERVKQRGALLSVEDAALVLRHGKKIDSLSRDDRRRVDELARQGEAALREGDYFRAERRFEQARMLASDNPLAEVGIAHAQLGAGLYLSASLSLRNLFMAFPELIDARYDRELFPATERLDRAIETMRERMKRGDEVAGYGLILAYIGHQTGDRALIEEGLAGISGTEKLDASRKLLEAVWLGEAK
ncbi:MAG: tetratricopeptide repeat protein [Phycisphaerales bacterium]